MKTRIKTGVVLGLVVVSMICIGKAFPGYFIYDLFFSVVGGIAIWEVLHNTGFVKSKFINAASIVFTVFNVLTFGQINDYFNIDVTKEYVVAAFLLITYFYSMFNKHSSALEPVVAMSFSLILGYSFGSLLNLLSREAESGFFYMFLCCGFAWVTDMGAYFVGVTCGKHKLCPELSPKKTVEGAIGGVISCLVIVFAFCEIFNLCSASYQCNTLNIMIVTAPLSVVSMLGDLVFSYIKRYCGIKDYGTLLPGHGGILDRFDSVLVISPILYAFTKVLPLIQKI